MRLVFARYQLAQYLILFVQVLEFTVKVIDGCKGASRFNFQSHLK
jgi:hypothetical protein